jgi:NAD(P)H-dependent flavin oxidoreductase YrpB (nitropropane dioxygenase family)
MHLHTAICDSLGITLPIFQGPMGGATSPAFAAAFADAGGLGTLALGTRSLEEVNTIIQATQALTSNPLAVNLVLEWEQKDRVTLCLDLGVKNLWFAWGDPSPFVQQVHDAGGRVIHTIASAEEAKKSVDAGVDIIVAQGWEAGGHIWGEVATMPLVPAVVDAVGTVPVIAAGGIADGRGVAAALALGASGVVIGTRLLASTEAVIHQVYKEMLLNAKETDTVYNDLFNIGWPNSWMRTLRNSTYNAWQKLGKGKPGERPGEGDIIAKVSSKEFPRYSYALPTAAMDGELEAMALYAGQGVGLIHKIKPLQAILDELQTDALKVIQHLASISN